MNKTFDPEEHGMILCPVSEGKGFVMNPERQCCQKCGGFGYSPLPNSSFDAGASK